MIMRILGLDISKASASYWILDSIPEDPKSFARLHREQKLEATPEGKETLLSLEFDFAVLEPTGVYSRIWRHWLKEADKPYRLVGHWELKSYRESWKIQSKTDKLDGLAMAMYGLEKVDRPTAWITENDTTLSDLVLLYNHIKQQKNGYQNNFRQRLSYQLPEWYNRQLKRPWKETTPGILLTIADKENRYAKKWQQDIENSCGMGIQDNTKAIARILIAIEQEEIELENQIDRELEKPKYQPYLRAAEKANIIGKLLQVSLISCIYPFEKFLLNGKPKIIHTLSKEKGKRVMKDESLREFKLMCGIGLVWVQSGDWEGWVAGGSAFTRKILYTTLAAYYKGYKKKVKRGEELNEIEQDFQVIKHQFDKQGIMKVARKWVERFYKELVKEFTI